MRFICLIAIAALARAATHDTADVRGDFKRLLSEFGSGSGETGSGEFSPPPPPSPFSPPGAPGQIPITQYSTYVSMVAAGNVADYTPSKRLAIARVFSTAAAVPVENVTLTVSPGSVVITTKIIVASSTAAATVTSDLSTSLASPALATSFFSGVAGGVSIVSTPSVTPVTESVIEYSPPPPSPPVGDDDDDDDDGGLSGGAAAGITIGVLGAVGLIGGGIYYTRKDGALSSGDSFKAVNIEMDGRENV